MGRLIAMPPYKAEYSRPVTVDDLLGGLAAEGQLDLSDLVPEEGRLPQAVAGPLQGFL